MRTDPSSAPRRLRLRSRPRGIRGQLAWLGLAVLLVVSQGCAASDDAQSPATTRPTEPVETEWEAEAPAAATSAPAATTTVPVDAEEGPSTAALAEQVKESIIAAGAPEPSDAQATCIAQAMQRIYTPEELQAVYDAPYDPNVGGTAEQAQAMSDSVNACLT